MGMFEKNVGITDKIARIIVALGLIYAYYAGYVAAPWSYLALLIAIVLLATAAMGSCYLYTLLGMDTLGKKGKKKK
ncbi:Uncharacterised protein [uncultured archaeon]|nr:Uncharacterised protein [uncultured archaeon]